MKSFKRNYINSIRFEPSTTWLLSCCAEARGKQEMWNKLRPEILKELRESAIIQSSESSNRIEGVEVEKNRLAPLVLGKTAPRDRSEEEIVGYRQALNHIHDNYQDIRIDAELILKLHAFAQGGMVGDAGKWKSRDNEIIEFSPSGERSVRFKLLSAKETPAAIEQLCLGYKQVLQNNELPELVAIANFVFDFLSIHPFRDGNGRVSRLLTLLLIYQQNYEVGKYVSLERIIEETKVDYYEVLKSSSTGWHDSEHNLVPWWHYFLGIIRNAYQELQNRVELSTTGDSKSSLIKQTILSLGHPFSISDICNMHKSLDRELVKKVVFAMRDDGQLKKTGKGRGTRWERV